MRACFNLSRNAGLAAILWGSVVWAEAQVGQPIPPQTPLQNPNVLPSFDAGFFSSGAGTGNSPTAAQPGAATAGGRYLAEDADYNTAQRAGWVQTCGALKDSDTRAYRDCFQRERTKSQKALKENFDEVERRQASPFRNTAPNPAESLQKEPAFGGVLEEKD